MAAPKKSKRGAIRYHVSADDFTTIWTNSTTIEEVMTKTSMPKNAIYSRVNSYRKKGVKLKSMRRPHKTIDVDRLNRIATAQSQPTKVAK